MARVMGIGGVFFKSRSEATRLAAWYQTHLGIPLESFGGAILKWPDDTAEATRTGSSPGSWTRTGTKWSCGSP
jgi:hypothetical protein